MKSAPLGDWNSRLECLTLGSRREEFLCIKFQTITVRQISIVNQSTALESTSLSLEMKRISSRKNLS